MVAAGDDIDATRKDFLGGFDGDAGAAGGIFAVRDDGSEPVALAKHRDKVGHSLASGLAYDIAYEKNLHRGQIRAGEGESHVVSVRAGIWGGVDFSGVILKADYFAFNSFQSIRNQGHRWFQKWFQRGFANEGATSERGAGEWPWGREAGGKLVSWRSQPVAAWDRRVAVASIERVHRS